VSGLHHAILAATAIAAVGVLASAGLLTHGRFELHHAVGQSVGELD
jgi:hypothetical protein